MSAVLICKVLSVALVNEITQHVYPQVE